MLHYQPWLATLVFAVGNCGFWLFWFNRVNAIGLPRKTTKRIEKGIVAICFAIPLTIALIEWQPLRAWLSTSTWWPRGAPLSQLWGAWCFAATLVLGSLWIESRRWLWPPRNLLSSQGLLYDVSQQVGSPTAVDPLTARFASLPGNQICLLEVNRKEIRLPRRIPLADGLRIGHLSDLHFTGKYSQAHYHFAVDRLAELQPDLIVLTGDIVDFPQQLDWIQPILGRLQAPLGCFYVLGNHDLRLPTIQPLLEAMRSIGFFDIGADNHTIKVPDGLLIQLFGNENPWFERHASVDGKKRRRIAVSKLSPNLPAVSLNNVLNLGLSHTPDQIHWARQLQLDMLLAGHTHGGQFRPPGIGPILSPSLHGSKFAAGLFYLPPTVMHVSRGVSGTHPLRWWCPPELSLLTLRSP